MTKGANAWNRTRSRWLKENPPNHQGYYECYICGRWIPYSEITIDHIIPRSRRTDLIHEQSNLAPCCWTCNSIKGSKPVDKLDRKF